MEGSGEYPRIFCGRSMKLRKRISGPVVCQVRLGLNAYGAKASANLYSLIETAKANDIEPYAYLKHVFTELPRAACLEDIEALLPIRPVIDLDQVA